MFINIKRCVQQIQNTLPSKTAKMPTFFNEKKISKLSHSEY